MKLLEENPAQFLCYDLEKAIVFPDVLATWFWYCYTEFWQFIEY